MASCLRRLRTVCPSELSRKGQQVQQTQPKAEAHDFDQKKKKRKQKHIFCRKHRPHVGSSPCTQHVYQNLDCSPSWNWIGINRSPSLCGCICKPNRGSPGYLRRGGSLKLISGKFCCDLRQNRKMVFCRLERLGRKRKHKALHAPSRSIAPNLQLPVHRESKSPSSSRLPLVRTFQITGFLAPSLSSVAQRTQK